MSEGEVHARLVAALLSSIQSELGATIRTTYCDSPLDGRYLRPPLVGRIRPDIFVRCSNSLGTVVGEAKSARDIDTLHTRSQLKELLEHLMTEPDGLLWIAVPLAESGQAFRIVQDVRRQLRAERVKVRVSGWLLGNLNVEQRWDA